MRKRSILIVAPTKQNIWNFMVGKSSPQEIATLAIIGEMSDSNLETGRYGPKSGVSRIIQESWQHWSGKRLLNSSEIPTWEVLNCRSSPLSGWCQTARNAREAWKTGCAVWVATLIVKVMSSSCGIKTINTFIHSRSFLENHTRFQTKISKAYARF